MILHYISKLKVNCKLFDISYHSHDTEFSHKYLWISWIFVFVFLFLHPVELFEISIFIPHNLKLFVMGPIPYVWNKPIVVLNLVTGSFPLMDSRQRWTNNNKKKAGNLIGNNNKLFSNTWSSAYKQFKSIKVGRSSNIWIKLLIFI